MINDFVYIQASCGNFDSGAAILGSNRLVLDKVSRAILYAVIAGGGRLDMLAKGATEEGGKASEWAQEFANNIRGSQLVAIHKESRPILPKERTLVCDWLSESGPIDPSNPNLTFWRKDAPSKCDRNIELTGMESLFLQAQIIRGLLGATSGRKLFFIGAADCVLLGDLVYRHKTTIFLTPDWPTAGRAWHAAPSILNEDEAWLEHFFYALRHCDESSAGDLSARSSTVLAAQEIRALCDAKQVLCWSSAQVKELVDVFGRPRKSTHLLGELARNQRVSTSNATPGKIISRLIDALSA